MPRWPLVHSALAQLASSSGHVPLVGVAPFAWISATHATRFSGCARGFFCDVSTPLVAVWCSAAAHSLRLFSLCLVDCACRRARKAHNSLRAFLSAVNILVNLLPCRWTYIFSGAIALAFAT
eukprot:6176806-Pleurochrysis_carterae.AAC.1